MCNVHDILGTCEIFQRMVGIDGSLVSAAWTIQIFCSSWEDGPILIDTLVSWSTTLIATCISHGWWLEPINHNITLQMHRHQASSHSLGFCLFSIPNRTTLILRTKNRARYHLTERNDVPHSPLQNTFEVLISMETNVMINMAKVAFWPSSHDWTRENKMTLVQASEPCKMATEIASEAFWSFPSCAFVPDNSTQQFNLVAPSPESEV
ncbi:hypothetical protein GGR57DRAFT_418832 [Xylariaceae sp. FL1272]|nr:hypothetical protein GGR57DRAFT_418832 [Xylariaceae sp. FL1272]